VPQRNSYRTEQDNEKVGVVQARGTKKPGKHPACPASSGGGEEALLCDLSEQRGGQDDLGCLLQNPVREVVSALEPLPRQLELGFACPTDATDPCIVICPILFVHWCADLSQKLSHF
jgi:hypothetical protein